MIIETRRPAQNDQGDFMVARTDWVAEVIDTDRLDTYDLAAMVMRQQGRGERYDAIVAEAIRRIQAETDTMAISMIRNLSADREYSAACVAIHAACG